MRDIPVYLFTGFLGAGKTSFIKETLENHEFGDDGRTLLLICENGEVQYDPGKFVGPGVRVERIKSEAELNDVNLGRINRQGGFDRVVVEMNGMWENQKLFAAMPDGWLIAQEMALFDTRTFMMYNKNMRQLCFNKMQTADMVVFNRCEKGFDKMPYHKEVRIANRRSFIIYEYGPDDIEPDDIQDPLPYDMNAPVVVIKDEGTAGIVPDFFSTHLVEGVDRLQIEIVDLRKVDGSGHDLSGLYIRSAAVFRKDFFNGVHSFFPFCVSAAKGRRLL